MSDSHDDSKITTRRFRRPRGVPARGARGRRVILAVAAAGALAAALLGAPPAHAAGYQCNLRFYYNFDGSPTWPSAQVNDPSQQEYASCSDAPAIARYNGGTVIAAHYQTVVGSVSTYVNPDGAPNWTASDTYGGLWWAVGPPAMTSYGGGTELAVPVANTLQYLWKPAGSTLQGPGIPASSGISQNAPAIARNSTTTVIAATGQDNSLWFYWNADGSPAWGSRQIVDSWSAYGAPAITADDSGTEIAFIAPDASLWFYWNIIGSDTWWPEEVSGPGTVWGGVAMTHVDGGTQIAAPGPGGSIMFFWNANGTSTWHPEQVAGPGTMQGAPAMVAANHTAEIAVTATDGSLRFYWSPEGTTTWYGEQVAPPGTTSSSPAMTRSSGGTEIAATGP